MPALLSKEPPEGRRLSKNGLLGEEEPHLLGKVVLRRPLVAILFRLLDGNLDLLWISLHRNGGAKCASERVKSVPLHFQ